MSPTTQLTPAQRDDLRAIAGMMIPASAEFGVPGADDRRSTPTSLATLGRDAALVREALDQLARLAGAAARRSRPGAAGGGGDGVPRRRAAPRWRR